MVDYSIDSTFDLHFSEYNDLETVDGKEEFQQNLIIQIHYQLRDLIGDNSRSEIFAQKVELLATRLAKDYDEIDRLRNVSIRKSPDRPNALAVEVEYSTGDTFTEPL